MTHSGAKKEGTGWRALKERAGSVQTTTRSEAPYPGEKIHADYNVGPWRACATGGRGPGMIWGKKPTNMATEENQKVHEFLSEPRAG